VRATVIATATTAIATKRPKMRIIMRMSMSMMVAAVTKCKVQSTFDKPNAVMISAQKKLDV
jgi:hypothetical protein